VHDGRRIRHRRSGRLHLRPGHAAPIKTGPGGSPRDCAAFSAGTRALARLDSGNRPPQCARKGDASMVDKVKKVWLHGDFVDWDAAKIHVLTHSFHSGLAAFEGIRAYKRADGGTYVFRLREHIDRLFDSCKMCLLKPEFTREQVMAACCETLRT